MPQCSVYVGGAATPDNFVDGTYTGSLDSTGRAGHLPITNGQYIWAVWSGGDAGATAWLSVIGMVDTEYKS